jgi:hypothetical protein
MTVDNVVYIGMVDKGVPNTFWIHHSDGTTRAPV